MLCYVIKIKQHDTGRFIKTNNEKCTGHVRGSILGFEMMGYREPLPKSGEEEKINYNPTQALSSPGQAGYMGI